MIQPLKANMGNQMMSNPYLINQNKAYEEQQRNVAFGEKLNINFEGNRSVTRNGHKLDIMA